MYSLRHLAAQKIPKDTHPHQPIRFVCKNIYREVRNETHKLKEEYKKKRFLVDDSFEKYTDALHPRPSVEVSEFVEQIENISTDIYTQYEYLEVSLPPMDHDEWYAYIEFIASRIAPTCRDMPLNQNQIYMVLMGAKTMTGAMKAPETEPCPILSPVIQTIHRFIQTIDKFIQEYDAKYSFEVCEKKQNKYGKALYNWQNNAKPGINRKIEFYDSVNTAVRPICSFIPRVCKKI